MHTTTESTNTANPLPGNTPIDQLQANLMMLMSHYTLRPCPHVVESIVDHICQLYNHPHIDLVPVQKEAIARLSRLWCSRMPVSQGRPMH